MKPKTRFVVWTTALGLLLAGYGALLPSRAAGAEPSKAQITVLYDAFGKPSAMEKDWGFAALIEYGGKRILFDTGDNPDILANNAKAKGVDLSKRRQATARASPRSWRSCELLASVICTRDSAPRSRWGPLRTQWQHRIRLPQ
jgi:hypothetical protein